MQVQDMHAHAQGGGQELTISTSGLKHATNVDELVFLLRTIFFDIPTKGDFPSKFDFFFPSSAFKTTCAILYMHTMVRTSSWPEMTQCFVNNRHNVLQSLHHEISQDI